MRITKTGISGTMESSDIMVTLEPNQEGGIKSELSSLVEKQFGHQIRHVIMETLNELGVKDTKVIAVDKGALDCTIKARVKTAAYRAGEASYAWGGAIR
jgi:citrate lyase subunit gamma (acyl carrier protein)